MMIEDQTVQNAVVDVAGKSVVSRDMALRRIQAACDARENYKWLASVIFLS